MTSNWIDELKQGADKERREREEASRQQSKEFFDNMRDKKNAERADMEELQRRTAQKIYEDNQVKRDKELDEAKRSAVAKIEAEYESKHGVRSDKTQQLDDAYHSLAKSLFKD